MDDLTHTDSMIEEIKQVLTDARGRAAAQVNTELLTAYWNIGRIIVGMSRKAKSGLFMEIKR